MVKKSVSNNKGWSTRDLLITIVIGLAFGVLLVPVTYAYSLMLSLGILARSLLGGVYYLPAAFAAYVVRKPGSILLVSLVSALVAMPFTAYGFIVLLVGGLTGLIGELVTWFFTRYRNFALPRLVLAGAIGGLVEFLLILGSLRSTTFEWGLITLALVVCALTFGICAALAKTLADAVAKTGVLANTALGRSNAEEI